MKIKIILGVTGVFLVMSFFMGPLGALLWMLIMTVVGLFLL